MTARIEYPRPQFERGNWLNLNGLWNFEFDDENLGCAEKWYSQHHFSRQIKVPFAFQSALSGIGDTRFHDVIWYQREFELPETWEGKRLLLHFGAVDYRAWVWVNGNCVTMHEGGHTPFEVEVTREVAGNAVNQVVVRVEDISADKEQPRGKQYWEEESKAIFYTRTSGIWQTVWLEAVAQTYLQDMKITPWIDSGEIKFDYRINGPCLSTEMEIELAYKGQVVTLEQWPVEAPAGQRVVELKNFTAEQMWSPETPNLFDLVVRIKRDGAVLDEVKSYVGMRKIAVQNGCVTLNNRPYYMKLVLDQGYFPDGLLTPPADDALRRDVEITKEMGFNGVRKHQKIEDPRYLYWADHLGLLVWEEMPSCYVFTECSVRRVLSEWQAVIERDYNHPCIVAWVPLNESWGVPKLASDPRQPQYVQSLYYLTKSLDETRLVISNDGWEHVKSDLCTVHDYHKGRFIQKRFRSPRSMLATKVDTPRVYVPGYTYHGEPILVSEFGGIAYKKSDWQGWGYSTVQNDSEFISGYHDVVAAVLALPLIQGFCYTQLTDVEQEINGLLTYDRKYKVDAAAIRAVNEGQSLEQALGRIKTPEPRPEGNLPLIQPLSISPSGSASI